MHLALACCLAVASGAADPLPWIRVADDKRTFAEQGTDRPFVPWGFNYDHDENGRLLEDYWDKEWEKVEADFAEMKQLGVNVVRIHLQVGKFLDSAEKPNAPSLARLAKLARLAESQGLYLDVTGLGCYHKAEVPKWYDELNEADRWKAQAVFWEAVAGELSDSRAVFCYDLMNEPVAPAGKKKADDWLGPPFGGKHFVQRISLEQADRLRHDIARKWIETLITAIRKVDRRHLVTVGLVDWSLDRPGLTSGFVPAKIVDSLDFLCVHLYPDSKKLAEAEETLKGFDVGKPLVIEETFPLRCSSKELLAFLQKAKAHSTGCISFYWGKSPVELKQSKEFVDAILRDWLDVFCAAAPAKKPPPKKQAALRDPKWDALFTRTDGWTGGDVAGTVDLGDGGILWLFGDTWIGKVAEGKHVPGAKMVNNSIAIHPHTQGGTAPVAQDLHFAWGPHNAKGDPTPWIAPPPLAKKEDGDIIPSVWYWPTGGGCVVAGEGGKERLAVFLFRVASNPQGKGVWNFRIVGTTLAIVDNYKDPVDQWKARRVDLPQAREGDGKGKEGISWGQAVVRSAKLAATSPDFVFIYGVKEAAPLDKRVVLARVEARLVEKGDAWEFFAGDDAWSKHLDDARPICEGASSEFSVEEMSLAKERRFVMVQSEANLGKRIQIRTARDAAGPWSAPVAVYTVPDVDRHKSYFTYAAKGHARLSAGGELLVTYLVNATDFGAAFRDAEIYRPRFIRVPIDSLNSEE